VRCSAAVSASVLRTAFASTFALLVCLSWSDPARAGGTDTTTSTDTTDGADESGTTTSTGTDDDGESSSTTEGTCQICPPNTNTGDIVFGNLGDGNLPAGETVIEVFAEPQCRCEDCVCTDHEATRLRLELNGDEVGEPCESDQCEFTVVLAPGLHDLTAFARYSFGESATSVEILVPGEGTTSDTGTPMEEETSSEGCGCRADGVPTAGGTMALALVGVLFRRRGRRR
jgi:MYXO-CTERM domain-containing protein